MRFEGRIERDGRLWLAEIPAFDALTQGRTRREALSMAEDLIETMVDEPDFEARSHDGRGPCFEIEANRVGPLIALLLRRQRERAGVTLMEVARRLGQSSPNAYARYETGRAVPSVEQLERLLRAVSPDRRIVWRFAA